jgi:hypothetical protein
MKKDRYLYARVVLKLRTQPARLWAGYLHRNPPKSVRDLVSKVLDWKRTERVLGYGPRQTQRDLEVLKAEEARLVDELDRTRALISILELSLELTPQSPPPP